MNPLAEYQAALDAVSAAVLAGDFSAYLERLDLPYLVRMADADVVLTDAHALRPTFEALSGGLRRRGVTHYERVAREARFRRADRIEGRHFTHMIAGGERIAPPHAAAAALVRRDGGTWRFSEATYPLAQADWPLTDAAIFGQLGAAPLRDTEGWA